MHTLKFYLRERVLPPGRATSRTSAEYGEEHVERVRLVRALIEHGGVAVAAVRRIVGVLESPPPRPTRCSARPTPRWPARRPVPARPRRSWPCSPSSAGAPGRRARSPPS
ncbi:MerR family transcriptional regulator [Phycicoccus sp. HDW14]|nr:MerR family transcriptional regulator [Phycicoccus sp. HDW14]